MYRFLSAAVVIALFSLTGCADEDTFEDIFPEARDRTAVQLRATQVAIESYWKTYGELPGDLDALHIAMPGYMVVDVDAWGTPVRYVRTASGYCLWSAGPDESWETSDDMALVGLAKDGEIVASGHEGDHIASVCRE